MSATTDKNKALVRRIYTEMWNKADPSAARQLFAHAESVEKFVKEFLQAFPDLQHVIEEMVAENDDVVIRFSARGTHTGPWKGLEPFRKPIHYTGITLAHIQDDKIIGHHTCWDALEVLEQIKGGGN